MISFKSKYFVAGLEYGVPLVVVVIVCTLIYLAFYSSYFRLSNLSCSQDFEPCQNPHLLAEIEKLRGQNIFLINPSKVIAHLTSGDYLLREGQLERVLPNTLNLSLQSVYPVLAVKVSGTDRYATLDPSLRVIRLTTIDPNVPVVVINEQLTFTLAQPVTNEKIVPILQKSLIIAESIPGIKSLLVEGDNLSIELSSGHLAIFSIHRDIAEQVSALRSVLSDATITEGVAIIDVRFSQPVLRSK